MKKSILSIVCIAIVYAATIVGCSKNQELTTENNILETAPLSEETSRGEVPRDRLFFSTLKNTEPLSTHTLIDFYIKDINTANPDYLINLKNMWFVRLNPQVLKNGTEEEKLFLIREQLNIDNNLAYFNDFYGLLISSKNIHKLEKEKIANTYFEKNLKAIAAVEWSNEEEKKNKETELVYSKRTFFLLLRNQK